MAESGVNADARRMQALVRPDGALVVPPRLRPMVASLLMRWLADLRRAKYDDMFPEDDYASDVLSLIDSLMSDVGQQNMPDVKIEGEATSASGDGALGGSPYVFLTSAQVAKELRVTPRTVRRWIVDGQLDAQRSGHSYLVSREALENYKEGA